MKVLIKILLILFIFPTNAYCSGNTVNPKCEKLLLWAVDYEIADFADGIKFTDGIYSEYFILSVGIPECCQRGESYIEIRHRKFVSDSLLIDNREVFILKKKVVISQSICRIR